ncbi:hypothetical protein TNIN_270641 [Trichonephila inaurata madagascariensis]|uniref:Integrase p58-like C-terminal domain-containing protein n=1 Tax=Trichonephila inaurata madagascariensis TaxID=2747483 RepID=A0A8X6WNL4_9ARAC|nr:hypothetical protein TNIN_270641 [Trichonephila inaurata madagascariensis]
MILEILSGSIFQCEKSVFQKNSQEDILNRILGVTYEVQDFDPVSRRRKPKDVVHVLCMKSYHDSTKQIETVDSQNQDIVLRGKKTNTSDDYKGHVPE